MIRRAYKASTSDHRNAQQQRGHTSDGSPPARQGGNGGRLSELLPGISEREGTDWSTFTHHFYSLIN